MVVDAWNEKQAQDAYGQGQIYQKERHPCVGEIWKEYYLSN